MILKNKIILLISPEPWNHIFVSKHHYATHLAYRGNKVYFLNPPSGKSTVEATDFNNVWSVHYTGFRKGLRFYPAFLQRYFILKKFEAIENLCDVKFDIVWAFDNSVFYDFSALEESIFCISHIVDLNQHFQTALAAKTADVCFAVSNSILRRLNEYQANSYFINHGYNDKNVENKLINEFDGTGKLKAIYAGNLSMAYLDWDVLLKIAVNNTTTDFIFIGPGGEDFDVVQNSTHRSKKLCYELENTHFIGKVNSCELHALYSQADILLISYQEKYHIDQSNPHKMMEYLGAGKVVVATKTQEYKGLAKRELIAMSDKNKDLPQLFETVLKDLEQWNSVAKREKRIDFAADNSYSKQIYRVEHILSNFT